MTAPAWLEDAACRGEDSELWFPHVKAYNVDWATPRAICLRCPVIAECLEAALDRGEDHGMFGGRTPEERSQIRKRPKRKPQPMRLVQHGSEAGAKRHRRVGEPPCPACREAEVLAAQVRTEMRRRDAS